MLVIKFSSTISNRASVLHCFYHTFCHQYATVQLEPLKQFELGLLLATPFGCLSICTSLLQIGLSNLRGTRLQFAISSFTPDCCIPPCRSPKWVNTLVR